MRTPRSTLLASMTIFSTLFAQAPSSKLPKLHLESDGHACSGSLRVTSSHLYWKSSFSLCDGSYNVITQSKGVWTLAFQPDTTSRQHNCAFRVITLRPVDPNPTPYREWEVAGYDSLDDLHANPPRDRLGCTMQSTTAR